MTEEHWLSFRESVALTREQFGCSVGRAQALVRQACDSGEVRTRRSPRPDGKDPVVLLANDDGILGMDMRPGAMNKGGVSPDGKLLVWDDQPLEARRINRADLVDWLDRHAQPPAQTEARTPAAPPSGPPKRATYKAYEAHQREIRKRKRRWATRAEDDDWARENNYGLHYIRTEHRRRFGNGLPPKEREKFRKSGPRN
jgi:hypothetical protein